MALTTTDRAGSRARPERAPIPAKIATALALLAFPAAQLVLRLAVSEALEGDESDQLVIGQAFALGNISDASQPPLYTWLQMLFIHVFGMSTFAVAGLRAMLQAVTVTALYLAARRVVPGRGIALLSALSFWLIAEFSVESVRKTHSVLVTCLAALFFWALLRVVDRGRIGDYAGLGIVLGLGLLAKYNFPLSAGALLVSAATVPGMREKMRDRGMLVAGLAAAVLAAPHIAWLAAHPATVAADAGHNLNTDPAIRGPFTIAVYGQMAAAVLGYAYPAAIYLPVLWKRWTSPAPDAARVASLIERFWAIALAVIALGLPVFGIRKFDLHWLQPILFLVPLYLFVRWPAPPLPAPRTRVLACVVAAGLALAFGQRMLEVWGVHPWTQSARINDPFPAVAAELRRAGFHGGVIVADHHPVGGNLRFFFPGSIVITPRTPVPHGIPPGPCVIAWDARRVLPPPSNMRALVPISTGPGGPPVRYIDARGPRHRHDFRVGVILDDPCR